MLTKITSILTLFLLLAKLVAFAQDIEYTDKVYDEYIKTVQLYPNNTRISSQTQPPIISLQGGSSLILEFDELFSETYNYRVKLIHCNANWQPSDLSALQYLKDYNEFDIDEFEYSFGTITPYVHYKFVLPKPILSGNYLLVVYARDDESDVIITRRFMVFEQRVGFTDKYQIINNSPYSPDKQYVQFEVDYKGLALSNPMEFVSVNITQNYRWDNAKIDLKPTFAHESRQVLEYKHFTNEDAFKSGNEFRYFDIRSLKYFGFHVRTVHFENDKIFAWVENDKPRSGLAYSIEQNINGAFFIENLERKIPDIENDYALVNFTLKSEKLPYPVYLSGKFSDWRKDPAAIMKYNSATNSYEGSYILKQGLYNYQYIVDDQKLENSIEGDKRETNNIYDIFVYYRSQELRADLLIGYYSFVFGL